MRMRPFEIGLVVFFVITAIVGLIFVSNYEGKSSVEAKKYGESVVVWGTFDGSTMRDIFREISDENKAFKVVSYVQIDPRIFDSKFVNAIAEGKSPDLIILPHSKLVTHRSKLNPISFEVIKERDFRDTYIDGAEIFMRDDGIYGIPFAVDPLVMYWNRDIFSTSGLSRPPATWDILMLETERAITQVNDRRGITQSTIAFGEYTNILHSKKILSMLFLQAGSTLVEESNGVYSITLNKSITSALKPGDAVLNFYTQFALSNKELYSWNRSKELDRKEFLSGNLALYFAPGSEYKTIERDNVNLNFDIAPVPQDSSASIPRTYGDFYAFSIPRASRNINGAYGVAQYLSNADSAQAIVDEYELAPALRTLYAEGELNAVKNVTYPASLIARGWLDPSPQKSSVIFQRMVEAVTSGSGRVASIISDIVRELEFLF